MLAELLNALGTPPQPQPLEVHHRTVMILIGFCASSLSAVILIAILRGKHYLLLVATIFPLFVIWSVSRASPQESYHRQVGSRFCVDPCGKQTEPLPVGHAIGLKTKRGVE
jgi:hypothetical protein